MSLDPEFRSSATKERKEHKGARLQMRGSGKIPVRSVILPEAWLCALCALSWPFHCGVRVEWTEAGQCLPWITKLAAVGALVAAGELLWNRHLFRDDGLLGWPLARMRTRLAVPGGVVTRVFERVLGWPGFGWVQVSQLAAAVLLFAAPAGGAAEIIALCVLVLGGWLLILRSFGYGHYGADRIRNVVLQALLLRHLAPGSTVAEEACLWFIAGMATLCYLAAGVCRMRLEPWQRGDALTIILRHEVWGHSGCAGWLARYPGWGRILTWGVWVLECTFPLALLLGVPGMSTVLAVLLLMHLGSAWLMGMNGFVWAMAATFPALLFVSARISGWLGR